LNFSEFAGFREFQQITAKMSTILVVFLLPFSPLGGRNSDGRRKHGFLRRLFVNRHRLVTTIARARNSPKFSRRGTANRADFGC
jgi:hypothetical protein